MWSTGQSRAIKAMSIPESEALRRKACVELPSAKKLILIIKYQDQNQRIIISDAISLKKLTVLRK